MKKILVTATNYSLLCKSAKKLLEDNACEIIENTKGRPYTFDELKEVVAEVDGVVAGVDTWDENVFKIAPNLKGIARFGVGVDNIDLVKAKEYGIKVTNCAGANANAVAEHCLALILCGVRKIPQLIQSTKAGGWERECYHEFPAMTVGLVGFGGIARNVAGKLKPFGCRVIAYDTFPDAEAAQALGVTLTDPDTVLQESDVISIHVPSLPSTYHLIDEKAFEKMKRNVVLVNTARGPIIDEKALYKALEEKRIACAAIDVYEKEPASPENPLFTLDNFIGTPHVAAESYEVYHNVGMQTAQALLDIFHGADPKCWLNQ